MVDPNAVPAVEASKPFHREDQYPADAAFVRRLDVCELRMLFDGLSLVDEAAASICNRAKTDGVYDWFEKLSSRCSDMRTYAIEEMQRRPMTGNRIDDDMTIGCVAAWDLHHCGAGVLETVETLIRMKRESDTARCMRKLERAST